MRGSKIGPVCRASLSTVEADPKAVILDLIHSSGPILRQIRLACGFAIDGLRAFCLQKWAISHAYTPQNAAFMFNSGSEREQGAECGVNVAVKRRLGDALLDNSPVGVSTLKSLKLAC